MRCEDRPGRQRVVIMRTSNSVSIGCRLATVCLYLLLPQRSKSDGDRVVPRPSESICACTSWSAIFDRDNSCPRFNSCLDDRTKRSRLPEMKPIRNTSSELYLKCEKDHGCNYEHSTIDSASEPPVHELVKDSWKKTVLVKEKLKNQMLRRRLRAKESEICKLRKELQATYLCFSSVVSLIALVLVHWYLLPCYLCCCCCCCYCVDQFEWITRR